MIMIDPEEYVRLTAAVEEAEWDVYMAQNDLDMRQAEYDNLLLIEVDYADVEKKVLGNRVRGIDRSWVGDSGTAPGRLRAVRPEVDGWKDPENRSSDYVE